MALMTNEQQTLLKTANICGRTKFDEGGRGTLAKIEKKNINKVSVLIPKT
jgi:hypothetical protein